MYLQILTSVILKSTAAALMLCATIPKDRTAVCVKLDFQGKDGHAEVSNETSQIKYRAREIAVLKFISALSSRRLNVTKIINNQLMISVFRY